MFVRFWGGEDHPSGVRFLISHPESFEAYDTVAVQSKGVIPALIPNIADTTIAFVGSMDRRDSFIPDIYVQTWNNRRGICFARLIDYYLLFTDEMEADYQEIKTKPWINGRFEFRHFYADGIIVKTEDIGEIISKPLDAEDMCVIYRQYADWWGEHQDDSIASLRRLFKEEGGILRPPYRWI